MSMNSWSNMSPDGGSESAEVNAHHRLFQFMLTPVNLIIFLLQLSGGERRTKEWQPLRRRWCVRCAEKRRFMSESEPERCILSLSFSLSYVAPARLLKLSMLYRDIPALFSGGIQSHDHLDRIWSVKSHERRIDCLFDDMVSPSAPSSAMTLLLPLCQRAVEVLRRPWRHNSPPQHHGIGSSLPWYSVGTEQHETVAPK